MPKHLFNWCSQRDAATKNVAREVIDLWAACQSGKEVKVDSNYGKPPRGFRGMFYHECGCGHNFDHVQDRGYVITDKSGDEHLVDALSLHLVACHIDKIDAEERAVLEALPKQDELTDRAGLEEILKMELPS